MIRNRETVRPIRFLSKVDRVDGEALQPRACPDSGYRQSDQVRQNRFLRRRIPAEGSMSAELLRHAHCRLAEPTYTRNYVVPFFRCGNGYATGTGSSIRTRPEPQSGEDSR